MNRRIVICISSFCAGTLLALPAWGQSAKLEINLDHLSKDAVQSVKVNLDLSLLRSVAGLLDPKDPDQARLKNLISGLQSIYVRSFEFEREGVYSPADVEGVRKQLAGPGWSCLVEVRNKKGGENADVCLRQEAGKTQGLAILVEQPKKLTVVNILGAIDLEQLRMLEGHLGVPKMSLDKDKKEPRPAPKPKEKDKEQE